MGYTTLSTAGLVTRGSFDSGAFSTLTAAGLPHTEAHLEVQTALYLPGLLSDRCGGEDRLAIWNTASGTTVREYSRKKIGGRERVR